MADNRRSGVARPSNERSDRNPKQNKQSNDASVQKLNALHSEMVGRFLVIFRDHFLEGSHLVSDLSERSWSVLSSWWLNETSGALMFSSQ